MGEYNPFEIDKLTWDIIQVYIKHGYGDMKLYNLTLFHSGLTDETACMTLNEFSEKAVDYIDGILWKERDVNY